MKNLRLLVAMAILCRVGSAVTLFEPPDPCIATQAHSSSQSPGIPAFLLFPFLAGLPLF
jgi:hypothetical protein